MKKCGNPRFPKNRDKLIARAVAEDDGCVSVGGLAAKINQPVDTSECMKLASKIKRAVRKSGHQPDIVNLIAAELYKTAFIKTKTIRNGFDVMHQWGMYCCLCYAKQFAEKIRVLKGTKNLPKKRVRKGKTGRRK